MIRLAILSLAFATCVGFAAGQERLGSELYPLQKGHRWVYQFTDSKSAQSKTITIEVERDEPYNRTVKKDKKEVEEKYIGYLLKNTSGSKTTFDHVVVLQDGVYRIHTAETPANPPIRFLKLPLKDGDSWIYESLNPNAPLKGTFTAKFGNVKVPAGDFQGVIQISFRSTNPFAEIDYWFAGKVGLVKQRNKLKNSESVLELKSFTPAR